MGGSISWSAVQSVLSDALTSFSPLATLIGADSIRHANLHVTTSFQCIVTSLAPIGALGMMATIAKGTSMRGVKDALGVGDADIDDAARDMGCISASGKVRAGMDKDGCFSILPDSAGPEVLATAVVRYDWTSPRPVHGGPNDTPVTELPCSHNFSILRRVIAYFDYAGMVGRMHWSFSTSAEAQDVLSQISTVMSLPRSVSRFGTGPFDRMSEIEGGTGEVILYWPAPGMALENDEVRPVLLLYGFIFLFAFILILTVSPSQPASASLFLGVGQFCLALTHVLTRFLILRERKVVYCAMEVLPHHTVNGRPQVDREWSLVDGLQFPSRVATRSLYLPNSFLACFSQYQGLRREKTNSFASLLCLFLYATAFICFYVGCKTSNIVVVVSYIPLFFIMHATKVPLLRFANGQKCEPLNNSNMFTVGSSQTQPFTVWVSSEFRLSQGPRALWLMNRDAWILAAHIIVDAVGSARHFPPSDERLFELHLPLYDIFMLDSPEMSSFSPKGILILGIANTQYDAEAIFWELAREFAAVDASVLVYERFIYSCIRALLSREVNLFSPLLHSCAGGGILENALRDVASHVHLPVSSGSAFHRPAMLALRHSNNDTLSEAKERSWRRRRLEELEDFCEWFLFFEHICSHRENHEHLPEVRALEKELELNEAALLLNKMCLSIQWKNISWLQGMTVQNHLLVIIFRLIPLLLVPAMIEVLGLPFTNSGPNGLKFHPASFFAHIMSVILLANLLNIPPVIVIVSMVIAAAVSVVLNPLNSNPPNFMLIILGFSLLSHIIFMACDQGGYYHQEESESVDSSSHRVQLHMHEISDPQDHPGFQIGLQLYLNLLRYRLFWILPLKFKLVCLEHGPDWSNMGPSTRVIEHMRELHELERQLWWYISPKGMVRFLFSEALPELESPVGPVLTKRYRLRLAFIQMVVDHLQPIDEKFEIPKDSTGSEEQIYLAMMKKVGDVKQERDEHRVFLAGL